MVKKIVLVLMLFLNVVLVQNNVFANEGQYTQEFYVNKIKNKVERNWVIPHDADGKSALVSFTVDPDGSIRNVSVLRSSGHERFDESAVKAVYKALPLESPDDITDPINIEFFFSPIFVSATQFHNQVQSGIVNVANRNAYINFTDYTDNLQNKLNANWKPKTMTKEKSAVASINIGKDGALGKYHIVKSSRDTQFDREILDTISRSVPYDSFPSGVNAPDTDVQLAFNYNYVKQNGIPVYNHYVDASVMNVKGYDSYTKQAEKIIADCIKNKRYFHHKDLTAEIKINKNGKLKYAKILKSSDDKNFDRKILVTLQKTSFPPIPEIIPFEDVTLKYEILTQRGRTFHDFVFDYFLYYGTTGLKSFAIISD